MRHAVWVPRVSPRSLIDRATSTLVGAATCGALVAGVLVSPAWAGAADASEPATLGGFALGDEVEGLVDPRTGAFSFALPVAGISVAWNSAQAGVDRSGLGEGWSLAGMAQIDTKGGVRVAPSSGGVYDANASVPSGLDGYLLDDVVFRQRHTAVPARADGLRPAIDAAFELAELGGVRTLFSSDGDPLVRSDASGNRRDFEWGPDHRLLRTVDESGVVTTLDWSDSRVRVVTAAGPSRSVTGEIELDDDRVSAVIDAVGGRTLIGYTPSDLVERMAGVSGAATEVTWQRLDDGGIAVDGVRVVDASSDEELSTRRWTAETGRASGWPALALPVRASIASAAGYATAVTDGKTTVRSEFDGTHRLHEREVEVTAGGGSMVVQRQAYTYPVAGGDGRLLPQFGQPTGATITYLDAAGGRRDVSESFAFDAYGRLVERVGPDGTRTQTRYDDDVPEEADGAGVPVGLPVSQRISTPDGLVAETLHELNETRTAHVATETYSGTIDDIDLTRTGRTEFDVDPDGFVRQERVFPQGGAGTPVVTTYTKQLDLDAGTVTTATTVAAGTRNEATGTQTVDLLTGALLQQIGPEGATVSAVYDDAGRPVEQVDAAGNVTRTEYRTVQHDGENATIVTAPDKVVTTTTMDVLGRAVRLADNILDGTAVQNHVRIAETREYPAPGVVRVTDARGAVTTATQDLYGRSVKKVAANGLTELMDYDDVANTVTTALTPTGALADAESTTTSRIDDRGRVVETAGARADGVSVPSTTTTFDGLGRVVGGTDAAGETSVEVDPFGNPEITTTTPGTDPARDATPELTTTREFDGFGASVAKALVTEHEADRGGTVAYDELGRPHVRTDRNDGTTTYEYTPDGQVASVTTSYGQITRQEYAPETGVLVRSETTSPIGATVSTAYEHHPVTGALTAAFDPADPDATKISFEYDAWGNPTRTTYPDGGVIEHKYDEHGRRLSTTDIAGNVTEYAYDAIGLTVAVSQSDADGVPLASVAYRYDAFGRMIEQARGNGVATSYAYTSSNQVARETAERPDGTVLTDRVYTYDPRGALLARTDTRPDPEHGRPVTTTTAYRYDANGSLTASSVHEGGTTGSPVRTHTRYELTIAGDIRAEHVTERPGTTAEATTSRAFEYGPTGTLEAVSTTHSDGTVGVATQDYDRAGNLTRGLDGTTYTYDALNRPVGVLDAGDDEVRTAYWATGQRAARSRPGSAVSAMFHWDGSTLLNDTYTADTSVGAQPVTAAYLIGNGRHARILDSNPQYYEADRHGDVTELTGADAEVETSYEYTDYGVTTTRQHDRGEAGRPEGAAHRNPFQYAGELTDELGTQYLQARIYDPVSMRLTTVDPEPRYNSYHYADLNPIALADPTGRIPALPTWASAVLAGAGLLMAGIGLVGAIGAYATAAATAAVAGTASIGSQAALGAVVAVAAYDVAATALTTAHEFDPEFLDDDLSFALGVSSAALGGVSMVASVAARAVGRVEINKLIALGAKEVQAQRIVRLESRIVDNTVRAYRILGVDLDETALRHALNRWAKTGSQAADPKIAGAADPNQLGAWDAGRHLSYLDSFETAVDENLKQARGIFFDIDPRSPAVRISETTGLKIDAMVATLAYTQQWRQFTNADDLILAAKNTLGRELAAAVNLNTGLPVFPNGYRPDVTFTWTRNGREGVFYLPDRVLGRDGQWDHPA